MRLIQHQHFIDKLAFFNGLLSGVALYPQVWAVITSGSSESISLLSFFLIFINSIVWFLYSVHRALFSLGITSILNALSSGAMITIVLLI